VDGMHKIACLLLAVSLNHTKITMIKRSRTAEDLHLLQKAFIEHDAFQCTPSQISSAVNLIAKGNAHTLEEIR
jgi:xanthine dehydrogenase YagT iron-sulfur-binding subunit